MALGEGKWRKVDIVWSWKRALFEAKSWRKHGNKAKIKKVKSGDGFAYQIWVKSPYA